jgi:hypothetical protein
VKTINLPTSETSLKALIFVIPSGTVSVRAVCCGVAGENKLLKITALEHKTE